MQRLSQRPALKAAVLMSLAAAFAGCGGGSLPLLRHGDPECQCHRAIQSGVDFCE